MPPSRARRYIGQLVTSWPLRKTWPSFGSIMPQVMRKLVVLPAPLGPSKPTISPRFDVEVDAVHDPAAAVDLDQPLHFQHRIVRPP